MMRGKDLATLLASRQTELIKLAVCKLLTGLSVIGAAWETARIVHGLFLAHMSIEKAAPHLAVLLFLILLRCLLDFFANRTAALLSLNIQDTIRQHLHDALLHHTPLSPELARSGNILNLHLEAVHALDDFFSVCLLQGSELVTMLPVFFIAALCTDSWSALLLGLTCPVAPLLLYLIGRVTQAANQAQWERLQTLSDQFMELLRGLPTLKIFRQSQAARQELKTISDAFSNTSLQVLQLAFVSSFALELITTLSIALLAVSAGLRLLYGQLDFLPAFFLLLLAPEFYQPIRQGGTAFHAGIHAMTAAKTIQGFLGAYSGITASPQTAVQTSMPPALHLQKICYHYPGTTTDVLHTLSLSVAPGSLTVLTGSSGSGKSTILRLLLQFGKPQSGQILINDLPLSAIPSACWQKRIAYVPQDPYIFKASLRENLTLCFAPTCPIQKDDYLQEILARAGLPLDAARWKDGLETQLGDAARPLSFGERKRLGLARALLKNAPVLLLDEITAGLDPANEQHILAIIRQLRLQHTILLASHRPAAHKAADTIICLDAGQYQKEA